MSYSLGDIANKVQGVVIGDDSIKISFLSPIDEIMPGSLVFADSNEKVKLAEASQAAAILVNEQTSVDKKTIHPGKTSIQSLYYSDAFFPSPAKNHS